MSVGYRQTDNRTRNVQNRLKRKDLEEKIRNRRIFFLDFKTITKTPHNIEYMVESITLKIMLNPEIQTKLMSSKR